jgi:hypothetical protein
VLQNPKKAKNPVPTHLKMSKTHLIGHAKLTHQKINAPKSVVFRHNNNKKERKIHGKHDLSALRLSICSVCSELGTL